MNKTSRFFVILFLIFCCALNYVFAQQSLKTSAKFPLGVAINPKYLHSNSSYKNIVITDFNSISAENVFKMNYIYKKENSFYWKTGDSLVDFAKSNGMRVHGHTLIYDHAVPKWMTFKKYTSEQWEQIYKNYIFTVVAHFKGKVSGWDVVNEAYDRRGILKNNFWRQHLGPDYIAKAFIYAHQADPSAKLFYNDYGQENTAKMEAILKMVADFKARNIPINGLGLQMHINVNYSSNQIKNIINQAQRTGLLVHISELTVSTNAKRSRFFRNSGLDLSKQSEKYYEVASIYNRLVPNAQQYGITLWNVGDKDSYLPRHCNCSDFPQLYDTTYQRKPAYNRFMSGLRN